VTDGKPLTCKQRIFVDEYLRCFNAAESARRAGYSERSAREIGRKLLTNIDIKAEVDQRLKESRASADEALDRLSDYSRGYVGMFFKIVDEWMFHPLPEYQILEEKEVTEEVDGEKVTRICYRVKYVALDTERVMDPRYSHLIKKFTNSRRTGLSIEMYSAHEANRDILKVEGKFTDRVDVTSGGEPLKPPQIIETIRTVEKND
jgi:hypothetical protein